jgi:ATP-binding cassette subfamily F protein 3
VLVSHDRHLLRTTTDSLMLVADGRVQPFDGDLDDYAAWLAQRRGSARTRTAADDAASRKEQKRAEAAARQARAATRKPLEQRVRALEADMQRLGTEKARVEAELASPAFYGGADQAAVTSALREQAQLSTRLEATENEWLALQAQLETL